MASCNRFAPGYSPLFKASTTPAGAQPAAGTSFQWVSSNPVNAPVTPVASDSTGLTANVNPRTNAVVGTTFTLTVNYTNPNSTLAAATPETYTIVANPFVNITATDNAQVG